MIETRYFEQLCPKPLYRIRNQYRYCDRKKLPVSLNTDTRFMMRFRRRFPLQAKSKSQGC